MALVVDGLTFAYPRAERTLDGLSFEIRSGEIFGFLGPSGAGKSTTQNILIRLLRGWSGRIEALGRPLEDWDHRYFDHVGVSFEAPAAWRKLTGRENLAVFAALHAKPALSPEAALDVVGLGQAADRRVDAYSKGMRLRLNLARALMHAPKLLFLDEPTAGLDPRNARRIRALIAERAADGAAVFLTTHDMTLADTLCDRVGFLAGGRLHAVDAPDALKRAHADRAVEATFERMGGVERRRFDMDGLADDDAFQAALRDPSLATLHSQERTLEDVFLRVTGAELSATEDEA